MSSMVLKAWVQNSGIGSAWQLGKKMHLLKSVSDLGQSGKLLQAQQAVF